MVESLSAMMDVTFYLAAIPAVLLLGLAKGGFSGLGMVTLPLMALVVPPLQGAAIIMPILMVQDFVSLWAYRRTWDRRILALYLPGTIGGLLTGALLASYVSNAMVELMVGIIATTFVILHWLRKPPAKDEPPKQPRFGPAVFWGLLSGFTSFIANTGGVPFQAYTVPLRLPPIVYAGTSTFLFICINWIKFALFVLLGQVSQSNLMISATLLPVAVAATFLGVWLVKRMEASRFYGIVTTTTFILGLKLIWDGARDMGWI
jgi:uncharacterized membrane protein YfcA